MPEAVVIRKVDGKPGQVWYPLDKKTLPPFTPSPTEVVVRMSAAALNHRDLFLRQHLYPGTTFGVPLLADGAGVVVHATDADLRQRWLGRRVLLNPGLGWVDAPEGPEHGGYAIVGGTKFNPAGTLATEMLFDASELEETPQHLSDVQAAALPLTGLTAWRALFTKSGNAKPGRNILVTGIGGGVALMALVFGVHAGINVYVSSGSQEKLEKAKKLGAKGGVNYKEKDWDKALLAQLPDDISNLDAIIDGAGGDIIVKAAKLLKVGLAKMLLNHWLIGLKHGGVLVSYGMTIAPKMDFSMSAVLKNIEVRGSTMGSRKEFADMIKFVDEKKIQPVISRVVKGMDLKQIDGLFEDMKTGSQFGKLVIDIRPQDSKI
jgi:NADPH:quinone reductase-like Zn-dependent oxidoreductase